MKKVPHGLVCADTEYDITRMQPQLFVARDFEHLFEVLEAFEATLAWKRGGDFGLEEALKARTVNHLVLGDGLEVTGKVVERIPCASDVAPGLRTALAIVEGPVMLSREGKALGKPRPGQTVVVFGTTPLSHRGAFTLDLPTGLTLSGFAVGQGEVVNLRGHMNGRPVDLPSSALVLMASALPSVAGGPADPEAWDRWFGEMNAFAAGDGERLAQERKASALPQALGDLYAEVRRLRESGPPDLQRLENLRGMAAGFPEDWLLQAEIREMMDASQGAMA